MTKQAGQLTARSIANGHIFDCWAASIDRSVDRCKLNVNGLQSFNRPFNQCAQYFLVHFSRFPVNRAVDRPVQRPIQKHCKLIEMLFSFCKIFFNKKDQNIIHVIS